MLLCFLNLQHLWLGLVHVDNTILYEVKLRKERLAADRVGRVHEHVAGPGREELLQRRETRVAGGTAAEAREREAEAEAKATTMVSDAIAKSGTQALNYFVAQKYTDAVAAFATSPNAKTILFPVEATQLIGSVGGIGELVKDALSNQGSGK